MKALKSFLRKIDVFGVSYTFKYKDKEKYTTALGGFFVVLFIAAAAFMGIYYFIPFYNRKNFTTVYYTLTMSHTEQINFYKSQTAFALGLNCWTDEKDGTTADKLFRIDFKYIYYKLVDNEYKKNTIPIDVHLCTKADFFNKFDETFDGSSIQNYYCLDDPDRNIEGIYTSGVFSYYEFDVYAKNNSRELLDKIDSYMLANDCKFQIFYSDNTIDIDDYEEPIKSYVEAIFIQINPTLSIRRNMYFMNQHLYDDNFLFWVFGDDDEARYVKTLFSRYEEYSLYQGIRREIGSSDYLNFAKVFVRADTKRTDVKRKYQKVMEFYADASSLLIAVFEVLIIIFNFINNFWAEQDLSKTIFFFKDLEEGGLNVNKRYVQINELIEKTEAAMPKEEKEKKYSSEEIIKQKTRNVSIKDSESIGDLKNDEVKIYNSKKGRSNHLEKEKSKASGRKEMDRDENNYEISSKYKGRESGSTLNYKYNMNMNMNRNKNKNYRRNESNEDYDSRMETNKDEEVSEEEIKIDKIKYEFNLCDVLGSTICKCCQTKELQVKYNLNEKANSILYNKLDIVVYVRNMLLFDIINESLVGTDVKDIINFLSRPIISVKKKNENELAVFYNNYKSSDFKKLYTRLTEISEKSDKSLEEKRLVSLSNQHLRSLLA